HRPPLAEVSLCVADKQSRPGARTRIQRSSGISLPCQEAVMKYLLIAVGLLAMISQVPPAFGRAGGIHAEDPWNPQHINPLPPEIRNALGHMCAAPRAQHQFAGYFQNSRVVVLHFERFRCGDRGALCTQAGCLHQVYVSTGGRYRLLRSYYAAEGD